MEGERERERGIKEKWNFRIRQLLLLF